MMRNRTKSTWFPAALAIASASVVSSTVDAATGDSFPSRRVKSSWNLPSPTLVPAVGHGNNGAPPTPADIADAFGHDRGLMPGGDLMDELIKPDPSSNLLGRVGLSEPGTVWVPPEPLPSTSAGGPSFIARHVGGSPIGQPMGAIPAPGTLALLGLSALALARRRRRT